MNILFYSLNKVIGRLNYKIINRSKNSIYTWNVFKDGFKSVKYLKIKNSDKQ